jgi:hypothetical protein
VSAGVGVVTVTDAPNAAQRPYAFVIDNVGRLQVKWWNTQTSPPSWQWTYLGVPRIDRANILVSVSAGVGVLTVMDAPNAAQQLYAFVIGSDGNLWVNSWDGKPSSSSSPPGQWGNLGTPPSSSGLKVSAGVGAVTVMDTPNAAQRPYAFVIDSNGQLQLSMWDGKTPINSYPWTWINPNLGASSPPPSGVSAGVGAVTVRDAPNATQRPYVFVRDRDDALWVYWWDPKNVPPWQWFNLSLQQLVLLSAGVGAVTVMDAPNAAQRPYAFVINPFKGLLVDWWG